MERIIQIRMFDKEVEVELKDNLITHSTIKSAFLLPPDAVVALYYEVNGRKRWCNTLIASESCFLLPDNWHTMQFLVESNKISLRPAIPSDQSALNLRNPGRNPELPIGRASSPNWDKNVLTYLLATENDVCITVFARRAAVTCVHCLDDTAKIGDFVVVAPCKGNPMRNFPNGEKSTQLKIAYIDRFTDFALLVSKINLCDDPPFIVDSAFGDSYVLVGLSAEDCNYQRIENLKIKIIDGPLCVKKGVVSSKVLDKKNKHMGDSGMKKGDSGGGLYLLCGHFIGIAVEFDSDEGEGISMCHFNPATSMLIIIQSQGFSLFDLNYPANDYPVKKQISPIKGRSH